MNPNTGTLALLLTLVPLLPLLGFAINGLGFRRLPKGAAAAIGIAAVAGSFVLSLLALQQFNALGEAAVRIPLFDWIVAGDTQIAFSFLADPLSFTMLLLVTGVGSLIHIYSAGYMHHDEGFGKFFAFLNLFVFSMLLLVLGSNYVVMFIGWEGVGLCSYLLIGFWNKVPAYNDAAKKAFIMNRIGDLGFLLGIFMIFSYFGTSEYLDVFAKAGSTFQMGDAAVVTLTLLLFVGAMGKSAQIPLYTWLPDAMAGPTPVSALIHAATMVTAGIYMVVRSNVLFVLAPATLDFIAIIGLATALFAATIGLLQNDIKKVLAYSTVSQLGYMFLALGVGAFTSGMFHVLTHAFFKALLFLGAGSVIHAMSDEQDIRSMGGLRKKLPITFATFLIGTIAISGLPPFAGFFSKDEILAHVHEHSTWMWIGGLIGSALTSFYMFRLLFLTFFGSFRGTHDQEHHLHESPASMTLPLVVLAGLAIIGGLLGLPEVFAEHHFLNQWLAPIYQAAQAVSPATFEPHHLSHSQEYFLMGVSVAVALVSLIAAYVLFVAQKSVPQGDEAPRGFVSRLVYNKYYIDEAYDWLVVKPLFFLSGVFYAIIEFLVIDLVVNGVGALVQGSGSVLRRLQTGSTGFYIFAMVGGLLLIVALNLFLLF